DDLEDGRRGLPRRARRADLGAAPPHRLDAVGSRAVPLDERAPPCRARGGRPGRAPRGPRRPLTIDPRGPPPATNACARGLAATTASRTPAGLAVFVATRRGQRQPGAPARSGSSTNGGAGTTASPRGGPAGGSLGPGSGSEPPWSNRNGG